MYCEQLGKSQCCDKNEKLEGLPRHSVWPSVGWASELLLMELLGEYKVQRKDNVSGCHCSWFWQEAHFGAHVKDSILYRGAGCHDHLEDIP